MNLISLNLKAVTPLELYFESNLKQYEEHFMMAFAIKGYTEQQLIDLNTELARMKTSRWRIIHNKNNSN